MSTPSTTIWRSSPTLFWQGGSRHFVDPIDSIEVRGDHLWRGGELMGVGDPWDLLARQIEPGHEWVGMIGYEMGSGAPWEGPFPDLFLQRFRQCIPIRSLPKRPTFQGGRRLFSEEGYKAKIEKIQEAIRAGDLYQVCLSCEHRFSLEGDPFDLFCALAPLAAFATYLPTPYGTILSLSPERFLSHRDGVLESWPIKGTAPKERREELLASEKERAELAMIIDLVRNDLSKVSVPGSVEVASMRDLEEFGDLVHTFSRIRSRLRPGVHPIEAVRAAFPAGSITGCPKVAAMEMIGELEERRRGPYTGVIGTFGPDGSFDWSVAIRICEFAHQEARCQFGGAIVIDSDPQRECDEVESKGRLFLEALER